MPSEEIDGVVISSFPNASTIENNDVVTGLHNGNNANFLFSGIAAYIRQGLSNIFVPWSRIGTPNGAASLDGTGKVPSTQLPPIPSDAEDITYDPTTSGLNATDVQAAIDEVQGEIHNLPSPPDPSDTNPQDLGTAAAGSSADYSRADHVHNKPTPSDIGAQDEITANGILKGDGAGGVSAATPGTDYQTPLTIDATPTANSTNPVQSGGVYTDVRTRVPNIGKGINLFDNPWFTVNQRDVVSGTAVNAEYFLSRWVIRRASYTISGHTVTVTATANEYGIYQPMKLGTLVTGKKYTISADIDGEIKSLTFTMPSATGYVGYLSTNVRIYIQISASSVNVWFTLPNANTSFTISKAKLELGEESTLDGDIEPNYEEELIKCQTSTADPSDTYANKSLATRQDLTSIQATGTTNTTGAAIPAGAYFYLNGILHRAKVQIDQNATFTVNTNCEQVTEGGLNSANLVKDIGTMYTENIASFTPTAGTTQTKKTWTVPRNMFVSINARTRFQQSGNGVVIGRINYVPNGGTSFLISQFQVGGGLSNVVVSPSCFLYAHTGDKFELQYYVETVASNTRCDGAVMCNLQSS